MQSTTDHKRARCHRADCVANPRTKPSLACGAAMYTGGVMKRTQAGFDLFVRRHLRQIESVAKTVAMVCLCGAISAQIESVAKTVAMVCLCGAISDRSRVWPRLWPWYVCVAPSPTDRECGHGMSVWRHLRQIESVAKTVAMVCLCGAISDRSRVWPRLWPWYVCVAAISDRSRVWPWYVCVAPSPPDRECGQDCGHGMSVWRPSPTDRECGQDCGHGMSVWRHLRQIESVAMVCLCGGISIGDGGR